MAPVALALIRQVPPEAGCVHDDTFALGCSDAQVDRLVRAGFVPGPARDGRAIRGVQRSFGQAASHDQLATRPGLNALLATGDGRVAHRLTRGIEELGRERRAGAPRRKAKPAAVGL